MMPSIAKVLEQRQAPGMFAARLRGRAERLDM